MEFVNEDMKSLIRQKLDNICLQEDLPQGRYHKYFNLYCEQLPEGGAYHLELKHKPEINFSVYYGNEGVG